MRRVCVLSLLKFDLSEVKNVSDVYVAAVVGIYGKEVQRLFCDPKIDPVVRAVVLAAAYIPDKERGRVLEYLSKKKATLRAGTSEGGGDRP